MPETNRHLLLVEDDESLRQIVSRHLRAQGYEVHEAGSAEAAAAALLSGLRPGAVILDLNLPGDTGWDLLRGPSLAAAGSPPVVITSATTVSPKRLAEFGVRRLPAQAIPARDARCDDRAVAQSGIRQPGLGGRQARRMTDVQIVVIAVIAVAVFWGYLVLCDRVRG